MFFMILLYIFFNVTNGKYMFIFFSKKIKKRKKLINN